MKFYRFLSLLALSFFVASRIAFADDIEVNKKIIIQEDNDLKPLKPFANECCAKSEMDLVPTTDRDSGHLNTKMHKKSDSVPRDQNRLKEGSTLNGYDVVEKSSNSKSRASHPELVFFQIVPTYSQSQLIAVNEEEPLIEMVPKDCKVFIRNIKSIEPVKTPTTQKINGEGKFGNLLMKEIPKDEKPLKNGNLLSGYDVILASTNLGKMLEFTDKPFENVPSDNVMSNRDRIELPTEAVFSLGNSFMDCR